MNELKELDLETVASGKTPVGGAAAGAALAPRRPVAGAAVGAKIGGK